MESSRTVENDFVLLFFASACDFEVRKSSIQRALFPLFYNICFHSFFLSSTSMVVFTGFNITNAFTCLQTIYSIWTRFGFSVFQLIPNMRQSFFFLSLPLSVHCLLSLMIKCIACVRCRFHLSTKWHSESELEKCAQHIWMEFRFLLPFSMWKMHSHWQSFISIYLRSDKKSVRNLNLTPVFQPEKRSESQ